MTTQENQSPVLWHEDGGVVEITLNRPEAHNAYDDVLIRSFREAMQAVRESPTARVVVLRGRGRNFQAGVDLAWIGRLQQASAEDNLSASRDTAAFFHELNHLPVPVVTEVQGMCLGGGTGLVASSDVVVAASDATFSIAEVRWGLQPGVIVRQLNDAISIRQMRRYALSGEPFTAQEAHRCGLVHEVADLDRLGETTMAIVQAIVSNGPKAVRITKRQVLAHGWDADDDLEDMSTLHAATRLGEEAVEGMAAFAERRAPTWSTT